LLAIVGLGCGSRTPISAHQIDAWSTQCRGAIAAGKYDVHRDSRRVRFRSQVSPRGTPVVVYGASWCVACDAAESYMARRSIPFVAYDVEEDSSANARLEETLRDAGLPSEKALPVIDVRGAVMVGFIPCAIEDAWGAP
jgi:glutaredoxin